MQYSPVGRDTSTERLISQHEPQHYLFYLGGPGEDTWQGLYMVDLAGHLANIYCDEDLHPNTGAVWYAVLNDSDFVSWFNPPIYYWRQQHPGPRCVAANLSDFLEQWVEQGSSPMP